ncbi:unnamed protein product, partial [Discosporangium mesarthrocarpum]
GDVVEIDEKKIVMEPFTEPSLPDRPGRVKSEHPIAGLSRPTFSNMACSRFPVALTTAILLWIAWTETTSAERGGYGRQPDGRSTSGWCFVVRPRPWQLAGVSGRSCSLRAQETQSLNRWKGRRRGLGW